jgi:hypothetical protein
VDKQPDFAPISGNTGYSPTISYNQLNNHNIINFNNIGTQGQALAWYTPGQQFITGSVYTIFTVISKSSNNSSIADVVIGACNPDLPDNDIDTPSGMAPLVIEAGPALGCFYYDGGGYYGPVVSIPLNTWIISVTKASTTGYANDVSYFTANIFVSGNFGGTEGTAAFSPNSGLNSDCLIVGNNGNLGVENANEWGFNGSLAEILIYNRLTSNNINIGGPEDMSIINYLQTKYRL